MTKQISNFKQERSTLLVIVSLVISHWVASSAGADSPLADALRKLSPHVMNEAERKQAAGMVR
jgi:hypothetical protein